MVSEIPGGYFAKFRFVFFPGRQAAACRRRCRRSPASILAIAEPPEEGIRPQEVVVDLHLSLPRAVLPLPRVSSKTRNPSRSDAARRHGSRPPHALISSHEAPHGRPHPLRRRTQAGAVEIDRIKVVFPKSDRRCLLTVSTIPATPCLAVTSIRLLVSLRCSGTPQSSPSCFDSVP